MEWAQEGVRINAVAPGSNIYSPTAASNYGDLNIFELAREGIPMKRLGTPEEVSVAFVSSSKPSLPMVLLFPLLFFCV